MKKEFCEALQMPCVAGIVENCTHCDEFITACGVPGHSDSGWQGIEQPDGQPRVLCHLCYYKKINE